MKKNNKGFSLVEIMIVLVIIGAILGIAIPKVVAGQNTASVKQSRMQMADIEGKLNEYHATCGGTYPSSLDFLVNDVSECPAWTSDRQNKVLLKDAWGTDFQYESSGNGYSLSSLGKDKRSGGSGPDKDIVSENSTVNSESSTQ